MGQRQFARRRKRFQIRITYHTNYVNQKGVQSENYHVTGKVHVILLEAAKNTRQEVSNSEIKNRPGNLIGFTLRCKLDLI